MISSVECTALEFLTQDFLLERLKELQWGLPRFRTGYSIQFQLIGSLGLFTFALHAALYAKTSLYLSVDQRAPLSRVKS